jgi:hypothetical protein
MNNLEHLKILYTYFTNPNPASFNLSRKDTHHVGIFSLVIEGTEFGKLTRVFISDVELSPYDVQLHNHRYPLKLTVINGNIKQYLAKPAILSDLGVMMLSEFEYRSPLNGGKGLTYVDDQYYTVKETTLPIGSVMELAESQIHTMSCSRGSIWVVEEMGFTKEYNTVLGVPFKTEGLYNEPKFQETSAMFQLVKRQVKRLIDLY